MHNIGLLQRRAGVDPEIKDLVCAFARLKADARQEMEQVAVDSPRQPLDHQRVL